MKTLQIIDRKVVGSGWEMIGSIRTVGWETGNDGGSGLAAGWSGGSGGLSGWGGGWDAGRCGGGRLGVGRDAGEGVGRALGGDAGRERGGRRVQVAVFSVGTCGGKVPDGVFHTGNLMPDGVTISFDVENGIQDGGLVTPGGGFFNRRGAEDAEGRRATKPKFLCVPPKNLCVSAVIFRLSAPSLSPATPKPASPAPRRRAFSPKPKTATPNT